MNELAVVGKSLPRIDGVEKATGTALYSVDLKLPGMLYGKFLRSPHAHARILHIDTVQAESLAGVKAVITAEDTPKVRYGPFPPVADQLPLATDKVRYLGDEVAAVAALDEETAEEAISRIRIEYEEIPAVFDVEEAMRPGAPLVHEAEGNVAWVSGLEAGDVERGLAEADLVVEDRFVTCPVQHASLEPHVCVANFDRSGRLTVWSSTQSPYYLHRSLATALAMPLGAIRVIKPYVGGGFGSKIDMLPLEVCCAILSRKAGRPVKMVYTRREQLTVSRVRVPFIIELKTGVTRDGTLTARQGRILADNGAYTDHGPIVLGNAGSIFASLYRVANIKYEAFLVYTNKQIAGAFRGFGNPQVTFAIESQMDTIAEKLGMDPLGLRLKNAVQPGDVTACKFKVTSCGLGESILRCAEAAQWRVKRGQGRHRGIGMACMIHVSGARSGVPCDTSAALIKVNDDGTVDLLTGASDVGQGSDTVLAQIAAEELGVRLEDIHMTTADTAITPIDLGTYATRVTFIAGNAVRTAASDAKGQLFEVAAEMLEASLEDLEARDRRIYVKGAPERGVSVADVAMTSQYGKERPIIGRGYYNPPSEQADHITGHGNVAPAYVFATQMAEVEVDTDTGQVKVLNVTAAHDLGRAINPLAAEGQVEGAAGQGLGYALTESMKYDGGKVLNDRLSDYQVPTALDTPRVFPILVETNDPEGPYGAKGVAEPGSVPTAAAVANAIYNAVGVRMKELPITPEKLLWALREKGEKI